MHSEDIKLLMKPDYKWFDLNRHYEDQRDEVICLLGFTN